MTGVSYHTMQTLAVVGEPVSHLGEAFALLAALNWSVALILFKFSGASVPPLSLNLFKNVVAIILFVGLLIFVRPDTAFFTMDNLPDLCLTMLSGILGIAVADSLLFYSLNLVGVSVVAILECTYTPFVILFAWSMLSEQVSTHQLVGGTMVVSAILLVSGHRLPEHRTRTQLLGGIALGVVAIALMAFGIVLVKPILENGPLIEITFMRLVGGTVVLAAILGVSRQRRKWFSVFRPCPVWRTSVPASVLGSFLAMVFWVGGYKYTSAAVAAILNQTSTIMALVLARLILKESFTRRKAIAAAMALCGILIVTLGGR